jgi:hypothetical protein
MRLSLVVAGLLSVPGVALATEYKALEPSNISTLNKSTPDKAPWDRLGPLETVILSKNGNSNGPLSCKVSINFKRAKNEFEGSNTDIDRMYAYCGAVDQKNISASNESSYLVKDLNTEKALVKKINELTFRRLTLRGTDLSRGNGAPEGLSAPTSSGARTLDTPLFPVPKAVEESRGCEDLPTCISLLESMLAYPGLSGVVFSENNLGTTAILVADRTVCHVIISPPRTVQTQRRTLGCKKYQAGSEYNSSDFSSMVGAAPGALGFDRIGAAMDYILKNPNKYPYLQSLESEITESLKLMADQMRERSQ